MLIIYRYKTDDSPNQDTSWKSHTLRVDCLGSSKGLFMGLFFLTISLVCLILFFVFASQTQYRRLGLFLADAAHSTLLIVSLIAMAIGAYRYTPALLIDELPRSLYCAVNCFSASLLLILLLRLAARWHCLDLRTNCYRR